MMTILNMYYSSLKQKGPIPSSMTGSNKLLKLRNVERHNFVKCYFGDLIKRGVMDVTDITHGVDNGKKPSGRPT
jgi:hypothetical protein